MQAFRAEYSLEGPGGRGAWAQRRGLGDRLSRRNTRECSKHDLQNSSGGSDSPLLPGV